jgi:hypothetical protein
MAEESAGVGSRFEYDVCFSFAGEDCGYVERAAEILRQRNVRVFYDRYEQAKLWGKNFYQHLAQVYSEWGRFCCVFVSRASFRSHWLHGIPVGGPHLRPRQLRPATGRRPNVDG